MDKPVIEYQFEGTDYIIEEVVDKRRVRVKGRRDVFKIEYCIKWREISESENTWEPESKIKNKAAIAEFEERRKLNHAEKTRRAIEARNRAAGTPTGFDRGLAPLGIAGAMTWSGVLHFLMEWEGCNEMDLLPASIVNEKIPQMVIAFYESRMYWRSLSAGRIIREEEEKIREILISKNRKTVRNQGAGPSSSAS